MKSFLACSTLAFLCSLVNFLSVCLDLLHEVLLGLFDLGLPLFSGQFLVGVPLLGDFLFGLLLVLRILTDGGMCLFIHIFNAVSLDAELDVSGELAFEGFVIILFKGFHVVSNMLAHDVGTMDVSVKLRFFLVVTRESFLAVGDFDAAIGSTLHGAKTRAPV